MLHITFEDEQADDRLRPIPFPRERAARRGDRARGDSAWMAERALERVQSKLDELDSLLSGPLPFPGRDADDDGPRAA